MHNAIGDHTGLTAARAGQNKQRAIHGFDGFALLGIELVEEVGHVRSSIACLGFYRKGREGGKNQNLTTEARRKI
jgi:hypothetical protein